MTSHMTENLKTPLIPDNFDLEHPESQREIRDSFDLNSCICDEISYLKTLDIFRNVKSVAIVGSLTFFSTLHLEKLLVQSGIKVASNSTAANCIILGWWIQTGVVDNIDKSTRIITEEDFLDALTVTVKERCRHIKLQRPASLLEKRIGRRTLLKDSLLPTRISHILGHKDAFNRFHEFLLAAVSRESDKDNTNLKGGNVCVIIYPPGSGIRIGIELICNAMGYWCLYTDLGIAADKLTKPKGIKPINIYCREVLDILTVEQIVEENKMAIVMIEDIESKYITVGRPCSGDSVRARGTARINVPSWVKSYAVCIPICPTTDLACRALVRSILCDVFKKKFINDFYVEYFIEGGRTKSGYVDLERVINSIDFYRTSTSQIDDIQLQKESVEKYPYRGASDVSQRYASSLQIVETGYYFICRTHGMDNTDIDAPLHCVIKEDDTNLESSVRFDAADKSTTRIEMNKLLGNVKSLEKQFRKDHLELIKLRRKLATANIAPCESYGPPNPCLV
ncbi:glutamate dehydrogenase, putative [Babesia ovata]|uniref:Glutamate dehydrogenase, putative n=1 Tax=Babesia ovata TaxID=189622 RepID=A0A2H6KC81_9APIC|nr:glutamate dehydrogenase, putative [Babesia ovata]GBE60601.1 glutamate dehydrogenase, putative [Babesia ovata]